MARPSLHNIPQEKRFNFGRLSLKYVLFGFGMVFIVFGVFFSVRAYQFEVGSVETTGTVIDVVVDVSTLLNPRDYSNSTTTIQYQNSAGETFELTIDRNSTVSSDSVGDTLPVRYLIDNPQEAQVASSPNLIPVVGTFAIGATLIFLAAWMIRNERSI